MLASHVLRFAALAYEDDDGDRELSTCFLASGNVKFCVYFTRKIRFS